MRKTTEDSKRLTTEVVSPRTAAEMLGVSPEWIYNLIWRRRIAASKSPDGRWQIPTSAVEDRRRMMEVWHAAD